MKRTVVWGLALAAGLSGCLSDDSDPGDESGTSTEPERPLGAAASDISMAGGVTWSGTNAITLGSIDSQTCFLDGATGAFVGNPDYINQFGTFVPADKAEVRVFPNYTTRMWEAQTSWGTGAGVEEHVVCINVPFTGSSVHTFSWADNITTQGYTGTANTHCFLSDIWATTGLDGTVDNGEVTQIKLESFVEGSSVEWDMNGSYVHDIDGESSYGGATAICVDEAATGLWGYTFVGPTSVPLRDSYPSGAEVATANTLCSLTSVIGDWQGAGLSNGVNLSNSGTDWSVVATSGRTAGVACVR